MAKVYVSEVEKLKAELRDQMESFVNLKESHDAQAYEITGVKQMYEDLKGDLENKESIIKHISSANDKLRENYDEKFRKWEDEKRTLVLALEKAYMKKAESSIPNKKCLDAKKSLKAAKEDDRFHKLLEEEKKMTEEQLKWKKERFDQHLEEAHDEKPRDELNSSEYGDLETFTLLDDISSLQTKLHSQIKISEHLEHQLQAAKQALAREESRRKQLEAQVLESKVGSDNASSENNVGVLEHKIEKLEKENQELKLRQESSDSLIIELKLQNEEMSVMLLVLKQGISEVEAMDNESKEESEEHSLQIELDRYKEKLEEVYDALERAHFELDMKACEGNELECELETWKLTCERMKKDLEESHVRRKELEASLLAQVVFGESLRLERRIEEQQVKEAESDKVRFLQIIEEKDKILELLQKEIEWLEQESFKREFESAVVVKSHMERTTGHEKEKFIHLMNERKMKMDEIMHQITSLQERFSNSLTSFSSQQGDDQVHDTEAAEALLQKLKKENRILIENATRLSSDRESLLSFVLGLGDQIYEFSSADTELMDMLRSMVGSFEKKDDDGGGGFLVSENMVMHSPTVVKKFEAVSI